MRVLHFYKTYLPDTVGGVEQVISHLAQGAYARGIEVDVLSLTRDRSASTIALHGHKAYRAKLDFEIASTGFSVSAFSIFKKLATNADIIHYHFPWPFMDAVHFAACHSKPTVVTYHSDIVKQKYLLKLYRPLQQRFLHSVNKIVASSPNYLATSEVLQQFADKVTIIPLGIDKAIYPKPSHERLAYWRNRIGSRFFLFVGLLRYYKGLHVLLEAARGTEFPIVLVGAGPIERDLKSQANQLGLQHVHFLGPLSEEDKVALFMLCYGVLFPSHVRSEAFGISLLEGAMFGKPMISTEIGTGTSFININRETGIVIPPNDPAALREAMRSLWNDLAAASTMGKRAEERYWNCFTASKMTDAYVELYHEVVGAQKQRD